MDSMRGFEGRGEAETLEGGPLPERAEAVSVAPEAPDLDSYSRVVLAMSGGKRQPGLPAQAVGRRVPASRIEAWHHDVDGRDAEGRPGLMDWPVTPAYVEALCRAFGIALHRSWRHGGIEGEMLRVDAPAAAISFETPDGLETRGGNGPQKVTRLRFPQTSSALNGRWCSAAVKIDVGNVALRNQERFRNSRTLFVTGERAEESPNRARYETFARHDADRRDSPKLRRHIDHWRPIHAMTTAQVWRRSAGAASRRTRPTTSASAGSRANTASSPMRTSRRRCAPSTRSATRRWRATSAASARRYATA